MATNPGPSDDEESRTSPPQRVRVEHARDGPKTEETVDESPAIPVLGCVGVDTIEVFHAKDFKPCSGKDICLGGRLQMPAVSFASEPCSILCENATIRLKLATLQTKLAYSGDQFLFHAGVESVIKDDGNFRYFAFDMTHSANYVQEEMYRRKQTTQFIHVFKVTNEIPELAFFADTNTWHDMSGRTTMFKSGQCLANMGNGVDAAT